MSELARAPSVSDEAKRRLEQAKRNLEQIKKEEESRKRRIAMRKDREELMGRRRQRGSAWWIKPLLTFSLICAALIWIAWKWPTLKEILT